MTITPSIFFFLNHISIPKTKALAIVNKVVFELLYNMYLLLLHPALFLKQTINIIKKSIICFKKLLWILNWFHNKKATKVNLLFKHDIQKRIFKKLISS